MREFRARWSGASSFLALAVLLAACAASTAGSGQPSGVTDADVAITSQDLKFDVTMLTVPADSPFSLQLTNLEAAPTTSRSTRTVRPAMTSSSVT